MTDMLLRQNISDFINYKRAIGYVYKSQHRLLIRYAEYAETYTNTPGYPVKDITNAYLSTLSESAGTMFTTTAVLREFTRFLHARGCIEAYMIPPKIIKQPVPEAPYFFTQKEIDGFFGALDLIAPHKSLPGREFVFPALFRLLYCCGLRCKEARTLECSNVHLNELYLDIVQSKGPKSRRIFITQELADYLTEYEATIMVLFPSRKFFFPHGESCYSSVSISVNFRRFWKKAFPDFVMTECPRAYDFRHHFAWTNLNRWAAEGLDVNAMIPYLMRYMGHQSVKETMYYFRFVPEFFHTYKSMSESLEELLPEVPDEE